MRVVIAEDLALLRDGLSRILKAHDFEVVAEVGDPRELAAASGGDSKTAYYLRKEMQIPA